MTGRVPSRRLREARILIGATLVMLVGMVAAEMAGLLAVTRLVEEEARRAAGAATQVLAERIAGGEAPRFSAALRTEGWGLAVFDHGKVVESLGAAGPPAASPWWPWASREAWEREKEPVAGPLAAGNGRVLVAYQPLADGRVVRALVPVSGAGAVGRWRTVGAALAVFVAACGGLLAWALIARVLAPYRELLAEAVRVTGGPRNEAEDRFLVETFRDTVRRLEASEAALRRRADELELLADVLTRGSSAGVVITEPGGGVRAANPEARSLVPALAAGAPLPAYVTKPGWSPLLPNVEDLQFAYIFPDGTLPNGPIANGPAGTMTTPAAVPVSGGDPIPALDIRRIIGMRVTITARSSTPVIGGGKTPTPPPAAEDHTPTGAADSYYHFEASSTCLLRNRDAGY